MLYRVFIAFFLFFIQAFCIGQQVLEKVYDVTSGLLQQEVTNVMKDSQDVLWVEYADQTAISSFDGLTWTHFEFQKYGLPTGLSFAKMNDEGMWFVKANDLSGEPEIVLFNKEKKWKYWKVKGKIIGDVFHVHNDLMYLADTYEIISCNESGFKQLGAISKNLIELNRPLYSITYMNKNQVVLIYFDDITKNLLDKMVLYDLTKEKTIHSIHLNQSSQYPICLAPFKFTNVASENILTDIRNGKTVKNFGKHSVLKENARLEYVKFDNKNVFTFSSINSIGKNDIYFFDEENNSFKILYKDLSEGLFSTGIVLDKNKNVWYATQSGLIKRTPQIISFLESNSKMVNGLHTMAEDDEGRIWFGGYNNSGWVYWDGKKLQRPPDKMLLENRVLPGAAFIKNKLFFFEENNTTNEVQYIEKEHKKSISFPEKVAPGYFYTSLKSGKIAGGLAGRGLLIFDEIVPCQYTIINKTKGLQLDNILTISEDKNQRLWMGRISQGIACYDPHKDTVITWLITRDKPNSLGMMSSVVDSEGSLWLGTSKGLFLLEDAHSFDILKENLFDNLRPIILPGDLQGSIKSLIQHDDFIIGGGEKGVFFLDIKAPKDEEGRMRIYSLFYNVDIPGKGSEQNALLMDSKQNLWVGTNEGAIRVDLQSFRFDTSKADLKLSAIKFGDVEVAKIEKDVIALSGKRSMEIHWCTSGNGYFHENIWYSLVFVNEQNDTILVTNQTKERSIIIPHLAPATYTLTLKAYKNNQINYVLIKSIKIPKLLHENIWFWVLLALMISLLPLIILLQNAKAKRILAESKYSLEQSKRKQDLYRIKSLSNFFNPHFINNTLHWLQGKYKKDIETATVIDGLANNVALLYQNIQDGSSCHSLEKELKIVENYLEIQQIKFENKIDIQKIFEVDVAMENIFIPSMIMQIHVENAVEKGIRNRVGAKKLIMTISQDKDYCFITIEDDGRGRIIRSEEPNERKGSTHVMNDLIAILNHYNTKKIEVVYEDFIFEKKYGTRVKLTIPKKFNYDLDKI